MPLRLAVGAPEIHKGSGTTYVEPFGPPNRTTVSVAGMSDDTGGSESSKPGDAIKRMVASVLRDKLNDNRARLSRLIELGMVDVETIDNLPEDLDFAGALRQFRDRISELAAAEPSVLGRLTVRPLDILPAEVDEQKESGQTHVPRAVAFCDLEGFTTFTSERGDVEASALLRDHYETVDAVVRSRGGSIVKTLGDGHMLSFREPSAAVMCCVDLVAASPSPLRLRAGGHMGPVVLTETDLFGHVVNVAARVTNLAAGGHSIVTVELRDGAGRLPRIEYEEPHSAELPGLHERVDVCGVRAA